MNRIDHTELLRRLRPVKIPLLILTCSLLILLSTGKGRDSSARSTEKPAPMTVAEEESRLSDVLQTIDGVGTVRVLLSWQISAQTEYVTDGEKIVLLSAGSGRQEALPSRTRGPDYLGAVIVCEGGDDPKIKWSVLEAVSKYTGLRSNRITVLKLQE